MAAQSAQAGGGQKVIPATYSPRVQFTEHSGKDVLVVDFRHGSREDSLAMLQDFHAHLKNRPAASVRLLGIWGGSASYFPDLALRWRGALLAEKEKILRSANVGFTGIAKIALQSYVRLVALLGNPLPQERGVVFEKVEDALNWLSK